MKLGFAIAAFLVLGASASAQNSIPRASSNMPYNTGGGAGFGGGGAWSSFNSPIGRAIRYEPPREFLVGVSTNDGEFVPTTFMKYEDALALGRQQMAAAEKEAKGEGFSLGEAARASRAETLPTLRLRSRWCKAMTENCRSAI